MKTRIAFMIMALILLAPLAQAELVVNKHTNDFVLSSPNNEQLKLCSCETRIDTLIIENTGEFYADYNVEIHSDYPRRIRLSQEQFTVAPKHFKEVLVYIEDSCDLRGVFDYTVVAINSFGRVDQLSRTIRVDPCQTGLLDVNPSSQTAGLCEPVTFTVAVENVGTFADTFSLDFQHQNDAIQGDVQEMYLNPGQEFEQDITLQWSCTDFGPREVPFVLHSSKSGVQASTTRPVEITNDFSFSLDLDTRADVCALATTHVPFQIENTANVPDEITLRLEGPQYVSFDDGTKERTITIDANSTEELKLEIIAPSREQIGNHDIMITAEDKYGGIVKERTVDLAVSNCYEPAVEIRSTPEDILVEPDRDCCGSKTYYVNVRNDADREQVFQIRLDAPSFFTLEELTVRLQPSQNVNVPLHAELPCTDETYGATVHVWPAGQPGVNVSDTLTVESLSERACYMVQIDDDELTVTEDVGIVPVIVKHTGLRAGNYTITSNSTLFSIREELIELQPGEQKAIHMEPRANLSEQEPGRYLIFPSFTHDLGINYNEFVGTKLKSESLMQKFIDWLFGLSLAGWSVCARIVLVLFIVFVVLAVALLLMWLGKNPFSIRPITLSMLKTLLVLSIVVLLFVLAFIDSPTREMQFADVAGGNATVLEWYQNEQLTVNLDQYFEDPDRDNLVYSASQPADVRIDIDGRLMTLFPDHNFAGQNRLVVTASDQKGGITDSPVFVLRVIPKKNLTFAEWVDVWCNHISLLLLIGIAILLLLMTMATPEKRQDLKKNNVLVVVPKDKKSKRSTKKARSSKTAGKHKRKRKRYYYATENSSSYHKRGCRTLADTKASDLKRYKSYQAATGAGLSACGICLADKRSSSVSKSSKPAGKSAVSRKKSSKSAKSGSSQSLTRQEEDQLSNLVKGEVVETQPVGIPAQGSQTNVQNIVNVPGVPASEIVYVGSDTGDKVHKPDCMVANRIPKEKRRAFSSKKEAMDAGLVPCKVCRPF